MRLYLMPGRSKIEHFLFWRVLNGNPLHLMAAWREVKAAWKSEYGIGRGW